jgi:prephenate dehydratase
MTRVAIQGVVGSYSEEAVREIFGGDATIVECRDFAAAFAAVDSGIVENAVIPIENKIVGPISGAVDLLESKKYTVLEKMPLKVRHVLAGTRGARFEDLISVRSHVEALKQCRTFLTAYPKLTQAVGADTASSIRRIVEEGDPTHAAIGSRRAADLYGAEIIRENIADDIDNWTVFYLIGN